MKAFFTKVFTGAVYRWTWAFNHRTHSDSWRKAAIFLLTLSAVSFMQLTLVIMPVEKDGKVNLYETERIEQKDIQNIFDYECKLDSEAYTQCSLAKYQLSNVKVLVPIFNYGSQAAFLFGTILLTLSFLSGIEVKEDEYAKWKQELDARSADKTENDETREKKSEPTRQGSSDS